MINRLASLPILRHNWVLKSINFLSYTNCFSSLKSYQNIFNAGLTPASCAGIPSPAFTKRVKGFWSCTTNSRFLLWTTTFWVFRRCSKTRYQGWSVNYTMRKMGSKGSRSIRKWQSSSMHITWSSWLCKWKAWMEQSLPKWLEALRRKTCSRERR